VPCAGLTVDSSWVACFQLLVTLTLDRITRHTVMHHSSTCMYIPNFTESGKTFFLDGLTEGTPRMVQGHATQKLGQVSKIQHNQIYILCCTLRINGHLPAPSVNGGGDRHWKVQFSELQRSRDLALESGHTAYRHGSLIDLYVQTKFHWNRTNFLWTDIRMDISPLILLGRLGGVDLKISFFDKIDNSMTVNASKQSFT